MPFVRGAEPRTSAMPPAGGAEKRLQADADVCQVVCKKEACAIQWCLARWNYDEKKCKPVVDTWDTCCKVARELERARQAGGQSASKEPTSGPERVDT